MLSFSSDDPDDNLTPCTKDGSHRYSLNQQPSLWYGVSANVDALRILSPIARNKATDNIQFDVRTRELRKPVGSHAPPSMRHMQSKEIATREDQTGHRCSMTAMSVTNGLENTLMHTHGRYIPRTEATSPHVQTNGERVTMWPAVTSNIVSQPVPPMQCEMTKSPSLNFSTDQTSRANLARPSFHIRSPVKALSSGLTHSLSSTPIPKVVLSVSHRRQSPCVDLEL